MHSDAPSARETCARLLSSSHPRRWQHVTEVARRAAVIDGRLEEDRTLEVAAWLHDVGYAHPISTTGFHPLDGARYLRSIGTREQIVGLVAFHSSAAAEADALGLANEMAEFEDERTLTRDLLWYLDMSTGPDGQVVSFEGRMAEVRDRYPSDHYVIRALDLGMPERVAAVKRATAWLSSVGLDHV